MQEVTLGKSHVRGDFRRRCGLCGDVPGVFAPGQCNNVPLTDPLEVQKCLIFYSCIVNAIIIADAESLQDIFIEGPLNRPMSNDNNWSTLIYDQGRVNEYRKTTMTVLKKTLGTPQLEEIVSNGFSCQRSSQSHEHRPRQG